MSEQQKSFWSSIPGILTGIAAVVTAATGLIIALNLGETEIQKPVKDKVSPKYPIEINAQNGIANPISVVDVQIPNASAITLDTLVDCKLFPPVNTVTSLMSWSNHYHKLIVKEGATQYACNKTIAYRAEAHCASKSDLAIRQGLSETLTLCKTINFSWEDVLQ